MSRRYRFDSHWSLVPGAPPIRLAVIRLPRGPGMTQDPRPTPVATAPADAAPTGAAPATGAPVGAATARTAPSSGMRRVRRLLLGLAVFQGLSTLVGFVELLLAPPLLRVPPGRHGLRRPVRAGGRAARGGGRRLPVGRRRRAPARAPVAARGPRPGRAGYAGLDRGKVPRERIGAPMPLKRPQAMNWKEPQKKPADFCILSIPG